MEDFMQKTAVRFVEGQIEKYRNCEQKAQFPGNREEYKTKRENMTVVLDVLRAREEEWKELNELKESLKQARADLEETRKAYTLAVQGNEEFAGA
ncbi:hypothetical protein FUAX_33190 [Fulvitalea axinellae]|uniref:Uncharacterized protein n=1 Tax=Fulvitalea axinellae TaxID=1182444 RepID=A0AAU9CS97_9BACT|nr:hypothetical protein FUAX_33190 [Fulvitalea axinellae]